MLRKQTSIVVIVIVALVTAATMLLGTLGVVAFRSYRLRQWSELRSEHATLADQLSAALVLPVWNFDRDQIDRIIEGAMQEKDVAGIRVRLADRNATVHARARDEQWRMRIPVRSFPTNGLLVETRDIIADGEKLGTVEVFVTPAFIQAALQGIQRSMASAVFGTDVLLVLSLSLLLWKLVLKPLKEVESYAAAVSSGNTQGKKLTDRRFRGELEGLRSSVATMITLLEERYSAVQKSQAELRESEERYRALVENAPNGIAVSVDDRLVFANPAAGRILAAKEPADLLGHSFWEYPEQRSRGIIRERHTRIMRENAPLPAMQAKIRRMDGTFIDGEGMGVPILYGGKPALLHLFVDITARKRTEEAIRRQLTFDEVFNNILTRFASSVGPQIDESIRISLQQIAGYMEVTHAFVTEASVDWMSWSLTHEWCGPGIVSHFEKFQNISFGSFPWAEKILLEGQVMHVEKLDDLPSDAAAMRQEMESRGFQAALQLPFRGRGGLMVGALGLFSLSRETWAHTDVQRLKIAAEAIGNVLERKRADQRLQTSREQLRALSARLQSLREEERTHLAREIHDHLGQLLTALNLDLRLIERKLPAISDADLQSVLSKKVGSARQLTDETITSVQKIASELRPAILDRLGLEAAIEAEAQAFQARTGIHCEWSVPASSESTSSECATAIFRIFQEILTNIARHAHASRVVVRFSREAKRLMLEVTDDGVGIREEDIDDPGSLGLLGMRERAEMLGGRIRFDRSAEKGTRVLVEIPGSAGLSSSAAA